MRKGSNRRGRLRRLILRRRQRVHLDHSAYFTKKFTSPQEVTQACLECHPQAATDFMKTAHWQWVGPEEKIPAGRNRTHRQAQSAQ